MKQCYVVFWKISQRDEECIASEERICYTSFSIGITLNCTENLHIYSSFFILGINDLLLKCVICFWQTQHKCMSRHDSIIRWAPKLSDD